MHGFPVITDDICAVKLKAGVLTVAPGVPWLQLWPDTITALEMDFHAAVQSHPELRRFSRPDTSTLGCGPFPLRSVYVLAEARAVPLEIRTLPVGAAFRTLYEHVICKPLFTAPGVASPRLETCTAFAAAVPFYIRLSSWNFEHFDAATDWLVEHLASTACA